MTPSLIKAMTTADAVAVLVREGIGVYAVRQEERSLEDVFMELTANEVEYGVGAPAPGLPAQSPDQVRGGAR